MRSKSILSRFIIWLRHQANGHCPRCRQQELLKVDSGRSTTEIDGRRTGEYWSDYRCGNCGAIVRWRAGKWKVRV
jgi:uncharacterized protein with PIN domain